MAEVTEVTVPDIGDFADVPIIEVLVAPGDTVELETPLIVLESEKATMEVPSTAVGTVADLNVKVGDTVSQGDVILTVSGDATAVGDGEATAGQPPAQTPSDAGDDVAPEGESSADRPPGGSDADVEPAPRAEGDPVTVERAAQDGEERPGGDDASATPATPDSTATTDAAPRGGDAAAGPAARRLARTLNVDLAAVTGSARGGRITLEDVARAAGAGTGGAGGPAAPAAESGLLAGLPAWPKVDFAKFGDTETVPRPRIAKIAGPYLARNWVTIPHVTQFDEADITELEAFRKRVNTEHQSEAVKVTMVALLITACTAALRAFPTFNSSLDGDNLIVKRYINVGFAADTPAGLMVPVIRDTDRKGLLDIARELTELSGAARDGSIKREQMEGGTFTISSLGGIGGTAFTPIINAPEVAILGVSRSQTKPIWDGRSFQPRLVLPLSLSYDHRVIDGAAAARFTTHLAKLLSDPTEMLL